MSKCMYCGSSSFGPCSNSPHQKHEHSGLDEKSVFSAVHPAMALVATARLISTNMAVETINAFIVVQPALAHVAIALMESMKSNRA